MTRASSATFLACVLWLICASWSGNCAAADAEHGQVVYVVASGEPSVVAGVEAVVRELIARLPVILQWSRAAGIDPDQVLTRHAPDDKVVARAWLDLSDPKRAQIFVANAASARFLVRVVPLRDGYDEVAREVLGHIIESTVDAFLAGREVGVTREVAERTVGHESPPSPPGVSPTPAVPKRHASGTGRVSVAISYQVTQVASLPVFMQGPAVGIGLTYPTAKTIRFSSWATLHYRLPVDWDSPSVGARFYGETGRLGAGVEGDLGSGFLLRGELGLGVDFVHLEPYAQPGSLAKAGAPFWIRSGIANAKLSLEVKLSTRIGLLVAGGCDVDLDGPSYFVADGTQTTTLLSPWHVHPVGVLGLVFRVGELGGYQ